METTRVFSAQTEAELWRQVAADMARETDLLEYSAQLNLGGYQLLLDIDIDLGGGFEGGYEFTTLTAAVPDNVALRFVLHEQDLLHELGKLLGTEDVELGVQDIDDAFIIRTNDPAALQTLFASPDIHDTLLKYHECRLSLGPASTDGDAALQLSFSKDAGVVEPAQLQEIGHMLFYLLRQIAPLPTAAPTL
ncbi:hypothetical protein D3Y59_10055 [Hymenobacter oligotrophus]|uniref:Uncharacterized protein n=1 Tax=Hymenobacter oligotrophus TaxID=2319843 RepID=A0A3B7R0S0_9BACT|nr:hypothetical protein [Hymenobacter oligotrophus]AYA37362.1 hypothetical protein D3Y59_10055 [Hymenobacter oligotrophus]